MLKIYRMPNGHCYQFEETEAPECAVLVEKDQKKSTPENKAKTVKNKSK